MKMQNHFQNDCHFRFRYHHFLNFCQVLLYFNYLTKNSKKMDFKLHLENMKKSFINYCRFFQMSMEFRFFF